MTTRLDGRLDDGIPVSDHTASWPISARPVPAGPRAYRTRIRTLGPFLAVLPSAALGALAWLMLHNNESVSRGLGGFLAAVFAAPLLPVAGAPMRSGGSVYALAALGSVIVWLLVGLVASRRATRSPIATFRNFWREWAWMAAGIWLGVIVAVAASNLVLGRALLF